MEGFALKGPERGLAGLPAQQDCSIQEKLDFEIRMREGIQKLLSLSTQKDQILRGVKNLMVCNTRIMAYTSELQKVEEPIAKEAGRCDMNFENKERTACKGKIVLSDQRLKNFLSVTELDCKPYPFGAFFFSFSGQKC